MSIVLPSGQEVELQQRLFSVPMVALCPVPMIEVNTLLEEWGHYLGACRRPFRNEGWALEVGGEARSVAVTSSIVSSEVAGYRCQQVVELSRLCTHPDWRSLTRVMLRLWREVAAPSYWLWQPAAAVAYSQNSRHDGRLYRFDGWEKRGDKVGGWNGKSQWSAKRDPDHPAAGKKTLWLWRYV